jgi:hypothetical protein
MGEGSLQIGLWVETNVDAEAFALSYNSLGSCIGARVGELALRTRTRKECFSAVAAADLAFTVGRRAVADVKIPRQALSAQGRVFVVDMLAALSLSVARHVRSAA